MFSTEKEMSIEFSGFLKSLDTEFIMVEECHGLFGIPDYIYAEKSNNAESLIIIAFELKLKNWRKAIHQAFRYRNFANLSFVVIDEDYVHLPMNHIQDFKLFNIGLASFNRKNEFKIFFDPQMEFSFCEKMTLDLYKKLMDRPFTEVPSISKEAMPLLRNYASVV